MKSEEADEYIEKMLKPAEIDTDQWIQRRIHHINFATIVYYLCVCSIKQSFYMNDLRKFVKLSRPTVFEVLKEFIENGFLRKVVIGKTGEYFFIRDENGNPKIKKYWEQAKKTLGIKMTKKQEFVIEKTITEFEDY